MLLISCPDTLRGWLLRGIRDRDRTGSSPCDWHVSHPLHFTGWKQQGGVAETVSRDRTATCPQAQACHSGDKPAAGDRSPPCSPHCRGETLMHQLAMTTQHYLGLWPQDGCRVPITMSQACLEGPIHSLPQFSLLALTCFTSAVGSRAPSEVRRHVSPSLLPPLCTPAWFPLRPPATKGPSVPGALGAIALAGTRLAAQPWPRSSPWFNDGQTTIPPHRVPSQGSARKTSRAWLEASGDGWHRAGSTRV